MEASQIAVLAVVQGITEFLPISSSAHLILVPWLSGWTDQGLMIDVALHIGTLAAVMLYFRQETAGMVRGGLRLLAGDASSPDARLALQVVVGTLPVVVGGFLLAKAIASDWRSPLLIAMTTIGFGVLLWLADKDRNQDARQSFAGLTIVAALLIGLAQTLALVPGVSRSGITITAALLLGFRRDAAARFSLLLSIPTTAAAGTLAGVDLWRSGNYDLQLDALVAAMLAFLAALAAIAGLMAWLRRSTFTPFVVYRLLLGAALLLWSLSGA
ncbi:MAG: undecaprenyl-diphosphate phosphatase [Kiloniellales bacterium]